MCRINPRVDFACLAQHEALLAVQSRSINERLLTYMLAKRLGSKQFVVTLGRKGCLVWKKDADLIGIPAFVTKVVDRIGAGDAFFSITSMAAFLGVSNEIVGFLGNVVGGQAVEIIGNKKSIEKMDVKKYITSLLK